MITQRMQQKGLPYIEGQWSRLSKFVQGQIVLLFIHRLYYVGIGTKYSVL